jgi:hypothetical protein
MSNWCRHCGQPIEWVVQANGRKAPVNPDGGNHFATCHAWKRKMAKKSALLKAKREREESLRQLRLF